jgi:hypothetical protein
VIRIHAVDDAGKDENFAVDDARKDENFAVDDNTQGESRSRNLKNRQCIVQKIRRKGLIIL